MVKDALIKTNPYIRKASLRDRSLLSSANSSTAIEGVRVRIPLLSLRRKIRRGSFHKAAAGNCS